MHEKYLSLSTQIEETISYKYSIVICNWGCHYYAIKLCFWFSHLECSQSFLNVSLFCEFFSWDCDWTKGLLRYFWLCDLLILVFSTVLRILLMHRAWKEITNLCLHNFLSRMSAFSNLAIWWKVKYHMIIKVSHRWLHQWNLGSTASIFIGYLPLSLRAIDVLFSIAYVH